MLHSFIDPSASRTDKPNTMEPKLLWVFVIFAALVRMPLLFSLDLHIDEQTFLNVGHDVSLGHLPYLHTWDNKPPLLFFLVAPITIVAHHQIWVVRLFATSFDILTSIFVKEIADRLFGRAKLHWVSAIWCFTALTVRTGGGALMSETIALPLLIGGALLLSRDKPPLSHSFLAGVLLGGATLVRGSPIFPAAGAVAALFGEGIVRRDLQSAYRATLVGIGGTCILTLVVLPYAVIGELDLFVRSVFFAPLAYIQERGQSSLPKEILALATSKSIGTSFLFGLAGLLHHLFVCPGAAAPWRIIIMWISLFLGLSEAPEGASYLIMLSPFACIFSAQTFSMILSAARSRLVKAFLVAVLMIPAPINAVVAIKRASELTHLVDTYAILTKEMKPTDTLYATTDYLLYWLLDKTAPHPIVTHAGNLFRPGMFRVLPFGMTSSADVMRAIVAHPPTWIVLANDSDKYGEDTDVGKILQPLLATDYEAIPSPKGRMIYHLR